MLSIAVGLHVHLVQQNIRLKPQFKVSKQQVYFLPPEILKHH